MTVPVAMAVVEVECLASWKWFLREVERGSWKREHYTLDHHDR